MRFVMAIVLFLVAFMAIGYGIAQRTILAGPASITAAVTTDSTAPITVIDGTALRAYDGGQRLTVSGSSKVFIADGRAGDVRAWVGKTTYNRVTFSTKTQQLESKLVSGKDSTAPSPVGSDLWVDEFSGKTQLVRTINVPDTASVIIMSDGKNPAPSHVSITWPLDNSAPWSGPLILGGIAALLAGLIVFLWALVHARRRSGPRRKQPRNPKPPQLKRGRTGTQRAIEAPTRRGRRRNFVATGVILVGTVMLSGCSLLGPTGGGRVTTPTPTSTVPGAAGLQQVAVTEPQLKHIVANIIQTVGDADSKGDAKLAATRLSGPALQLRTANYAIHAADSGIPIVPSIPNWEVQVALPQQSDSWPRAVFVVIGKKADTKAAPIGMMLVQQSARENYKVEYLMTLELTVPDVAPAALGAARLPNDNKLGILAPSDLAAAYGDILIKGDASKKNDLFSATGDKLRTAVGHDYKQKTASQLPTTAAIAFSNSQGKSDPIAFGTNDSGQIVAVDLDDVETVTPVEAGAAINTVGQVTALSGKTQSTKGIIATYGLQLLFYVPPVTDSNKKIQLLGFAQGLISATEVP